MDMKTLTQTTAATFCALISIISVCNCNPNGRRLVNDLLANSNVMSKYAQPNGNSSSPLDITVRFALIQILRFDQLNQVISVVGLLTTSWNDQTLKWDPAEYGDIASIVLPQTDIWTPDLVSFNSVDRPVPMNDPLLKVTSEGDVMWVKKNKYKLSCATSPEEREPSCELKYGSWSMNADMINLVPAIQIIDAGYYLPHLEWELSTTEIITSVKTHPCCPGVKYSDITFSFNLVKREEEEVDDPNKLCNHGNVLYVDTMLYILIVSSLTMFY